jgi:HD-GYP domain-containing protein (c-di-GMP phosphodiesterase class II)
MWHVSDTIWEFSPASLALAQRLLASTTTLQGWRQPVEATGDGLFVSVSGEFGEYGTLCFHGEPPDATLVEALVYHLRIECEREIARKHLGALREVNRHLQETLDEGTLLERIFTEVSHWVPAEAHSLWLCTGKDTVECQLATGNSAAQVRRLCVPVGQGIVGRTVAERCTIQSANAQQDHRHYRPADKATGMVTRSLLSVPIVRQGTAMGAIQAVNKLGNVAFSDEDAALLQSIAEVAALALENARLYAAQETTYDETIASLSAALDLRDHETEGHSQRVVAYAVRLAEEMGLDEAMVRSIRRGALLHDIGKIGIPDAILLKPASLTLEERLMIEQHPRLGYTALMGIEHLRDALEVVLHHHERWDGKGYPDGLAGEAIPLRARIFAIADALDAITSDRPYRPRSSFQKARTLIAQDAGTHFDPAIIAAFLRVEAREWAALHAETHMSNRTESHELLAA